MDARRCISKLPLQVKSFEYSSTCVSKRYLASKASDMNENLLYRSLHTNFVACRLQPRFAICFGILPSPMIAAAAMSFSSVSVIGDARRLSPAWL